MLYSSTNDLWLKLEEDPEPKEEPKEDKEAPESKDETKEADSEAQLDDSTTEETEQEDKLTRPRLSEEQIGRIYALDDAGWTASQIADDVGCGLATVYKYMNKKLRSK
jgi:predicted transcriptional regulator YheO